MIKVGMFTNGILLCNDSLEKLKKLKVDIQVSYPRHNSVILKKIKKAKSIGLNILTSTIFLRRTVKNLDMILKDIKDLNANAFLFPIPLFLKIHLKISRTINF